VSDIGDGNGRLLLLNPKGSADADEPPAISRSNSPAGGAEAAADVE